MGSARKRPIRIRTCIATGKQHSDSALLRVVEDAECPGRIVADPKRKLPGRGAWITATEEALELAQKRRAFTRALRLSTQVDIGHVRMYLAEKAKDPT